MAQLYASVAVGTTATLLATILLLLRARLHGRRTVVSLAGQWIAASNRTSILTLGLLLTTAALCFATLADQSYLSGNAEPSVSGASSVHSTAFDPGLDPAAAQDLQALRSYADNVDGKPQTASAPSSSSSTTTTTSGLPDVDSMIAKLVARLEKQPNDAKGWKMLGWSYLNTGRPDEAEKAYETALKLAPDDGEIKEVLADARAAQAESLQAVRTDAAAALPQGQSGVAPPSMQQDQMIRGMVDQLAARLEASPNDEDGWARLMRSRMTLGEKDAAKVAYAKALQTFSSDAAAKSRLTATARELGVESQ